MKTKIYNNLIFSLLFACSLCGLFYAEAVVAQANTGNQPPSSINSAQQNIGGKEPLKLHLYSTIFGVEKEIETSGSDRELVSRTVQGIFGRLFSVIFTLSGILMVTLLAVHGTRMIYAEFGGNVAIFSDAKGRVKAAAIGTAILLLSWVILNFIAPSLLRPRLFQTITGLREVGRDSNLYTEHLKFDDSSIDFDKQNDTLIVTRCPEITDDDFRTQVTSLKKNLQHNTAAIPLQYSFQVLYKRVISDRVYVYNEEGEGAKFIECDKGKPKEQRIQLPSDVEIVVALPVVSIKVAESQSVPNAEPAIVSKKFWRGRPWRRDLGIDSDSCVSFGKANIITAGIIPSNLTESDTDYLPGMLFPRISYGNITSEGDIVTGYHISTAEVKYCAIKTTGTCPNNEYKSVNEKDKVEFVVDGANSAGIRLIQIGNNIETFQVTPIIDSEEGFGECKGPLRGKTTCFKVEREAGGKLLGVNVQEDCVDKNIDTNSTWFQTLLGKHSKSTVSYQVVNVSPTQASEKIAGSDYSVRKITFSNFTINNWKEDVYGKHPFRSTTGGRGTIIAEFTITNGRVFFKHATQDKLVKSSRITGWRDNKEIGLPIYFKGDLTRFCVTPKVGEYELKEVCYNP